MNRAKVVTGLALVAATLGAVGALYLYGNAEDEEEEEKEDEECPTTSALSKGRGAPKPAPDQAVGVVEKARALREAGKLDEAEALLTRALALADASNPAGREGGTVGLASLLSALASLKLAAGHPEEAEPLLARTVPILGALLGFEHPSMATTLNNLASAQLSQNKYADAEANYRAAFAICAAHFGPDHVESATALGNLAVRKPRTNRGAQAAATACCSASRNGSTLQERYQRPLLAPFISFIAPSFPLPWPSPATFAGGAAGQGRVRPGRGPLCQGAGGEVQRRGLRRRPPVHSSHGAGPRRLPRPAAPGPRQACCQRRR